MCNDSPRINVKIDIKFYKTKKLNSSKLYKFFKYNSTIFLNFSIMCIIIILLLSMYSKMINKNVRRIYTFNNYVKRVSRNSCIHSR